jgi:nitrite reductase (NO-forming)
MHSNGHSDGTNVWPTIWGSLVIAALCASIVSLVAVVGKTKSTTTVGASAGPAAASAPAIPFGTPASDSFQARNPNAPAVAPGTVHKITLNIEEKNVEIAPGVSQLMWTYNGTVPGPTLRGNVGDTFEITLVNHGQQGHSIDLHASKVAPNVNMRTIQPGQSLVYTFTADHAGIFMYHCGTPPVLEHIAMGMYGAIIVDPPNLPPVDHEYVMVQSELYRSATADQPVDYTKLLNAQSDAVVFNGYVSQYADRPINVGVGQKIRVWVMDDGPSDISSFHVIGTIFDTVYKEGDYVLQPGANKGGGQALDLAPAQGGFVEFSFNTPGTYPFVTHKFADAARGAVGVFKAS